MHRLQNVLIAQCVDAAFNRVREHLGDVHHHDGHALRATALHQLDRLWQTIAMGHVECVSYQTIAISGLNTVTARGVIALYQALQSLAAWRLSHPTRNDIPPEIHELFEHVGSPPGGEIIFPRGNVSPDARQAILQADDRLKNGNSGWNVSVDTIRSRIYVENANESFTIEIPPTVVFNPNSGVWGIQIPKKENP